MTPMKTLLIALFLTATACGVSVRPEDGSIGSEAPADGSTPIDVRDGGPPPTDAIAILCTLTDGRQLRVGESTSVGCNTCTCGAGGMLGCTTLACFDGGPPPFDAGTVCRLPDGRTIRPGESSFDGCNSCFCNTNGGLSCTARFCPDGGPPPVDAGLCFTADGRVLHPGESTFDGCNSCFCGGDGRLSCTTRVCDDAGPPDAGACNTIAVTGAFPSITMSSGSAPAPTGGRLLDGRYELVSGTTYGPAGGPIMIGRMIIQVAGGVWQMAVENTAGTMPQRMTYWYMTAGTSLTLAQVCGGGGGGPAPAFGYDANPMALTLHVPITAGSEFLLSLVRR